ncbi:MAG TPA: hypothetical protein VKD71_04940 [Gemmataceae bacterium]|nr:hypothetical protein [Gemmataceae bacterium]
MRRPVVTSLFFAFFTFPVAGCIGGGVDQTKFERLKVGMSSQDVEAVLGKGGKEISSDEVATLVREALTPRAGPDGKQPPSAPKVEMPDLSGARGVRWGDDKKSITVIYNGDRVTRIFKKGF